MCRLVGREMPSPYCIDEKGRLRIVTRPTTVRDIVGAAFDPIRRYGTSSVDVAIHLLDTIAMIAGVANRPEDLEALEGQAEMVVAGARRGLAVGADLQALEDHRREVDRALSRRDR